MSQDTIIYIAGWVILLLVGGVIAFSLYAILSGRKQNKEYFDLSLPEISEDGADPTKANTLESLGVDDVVKTDDQVGLPPAPLPVPDELPVPDSIPDGIPGAGNDHEDLSTVALDGDSNDSLPVPDFGSYGYAGNDDQNQSYGDSDDSLPIPLNDDRGNASSPDDPIRSLDNMMKNDEDNLNPFSI